MRKHYDIGMSANTRYNRTPMKNSIRLQTGQMIRLLATYNKVRPVSKSMIRIEQDLDLMYYTIWDETLIYMLNNKTVRVRMLIEDTSQIYLFDTETDTYLGSVKKDIDVAGDIANQTQKDKIRILAHTQKLKGLRNRRKRDIEEIRSTTVEIEEPFIQIENGRLIIGEGEENLLAKNIEKEVSDTEMKNDTLVHQKLDLVPLIEKATEESTDLETVTNFIVP